MNILFNLLVTLSVFILMELATWFIHKYVMHGFVWYLHEDHHQPNHHNIFERNDFFFLIFATPSILLANSGYQQGFSYLFFIGLGIFFYGLAYFLIHDVLIHRRFKWFDKVENPYFRALRKAHKVHHKNQYKENGKCFGMLIVPLKYFKESGFIK